MPRKQRPNHRSRRPAADANGGRRESPSPFQAQYYRGSPSKQSNALPGWKVGVALVCLLGAAIAVFVWGRVETVAVTGTDDGDVKTAIREQVQSRYGFLWQAYTRSPPQHGQYPDTVATVTVTPQWRKQQLNASVTMKKPQLRWQTGDSVYAVGENGKVLHAVEEASQSGAPLIRDQSDLPVEVAGKVVSGRFVAFARQIAYSDLSITGLRIINTTSELYADLEQGYYVRFDTTGSAQVQLDNVKRIQKIAKRQNDAINQYIDVRLPYKAYYK
ncbi:hypothetical protein BRC19_02785 [Candidatus Saccharibacteria bacterium QS_5_54_17]|nr:MAG: hypothetical protein BRC19_02785 [Candidatus Saccharibacteria bacterium QS_5_54_17]